MRVLAGNPSRQFWDSVAARILKSLPPSAGSGHGGEAVILRAHAVSWAVGPRGAYGQKTGGGKSDQHLSVVRAREFQIRNPSMRGAEWYPRRGFNRLDSTPLERHNFCFQSCL
ncbi:hypothetical protein HRG_013066 [Hirsutella rhossiliensis]